MGMQIKTIKSAKVAGSLPYEGFRGNIWFTDGSYEIVMKRCNVGTAEWDWYPFDTKMSAERATRLKMKQYVDGRKAT